MRNQAKKINETNQSRRGFIKASATLTIGFALPVAGIMAKIPSDPNATFKPNAFIRIGTDNSIRIIANHAEMGQGIYTALSQIVAEELDADWNQVIAEHVPLNPDYNHTIFGSIATGGSNSVSSEWDRLRNAGATARQMLLQAAADQWGVDIKSLRTEDSHVINGRDQRLSYGELSEAAAKVPVPADVVLKEKCDYNLVGTSKPRIEAKSKVDGSAIFGMDFTQPDMLFAAVAHTPVFGGKVKSVDDSAAKEMTGVKNIVQIPNGVAVIAESFWQAKRAKDALKIEWNNGDFADQSSEKLWSEFYKLAETDGTTFEKTGEISSANAKHEISGEFSFPYLAHVPMEPLNATVQIKDGKCQAWAGTQFQTSDSLNIAQAIGMKPGDVNVDVLWLGGGFGRRGVPTSDYLVEAAHIAKKSGLDQPIKMIWQREDDVQGGFYRPMFLHKYSLGLDENKMPINWHHTMVGQSISAGTAFESMLVQNDIDALSVEGIMHNKYRVPNRNFSLHSPKLAIPVLWLRSVGNTHTGTTIETIINRLANTAESDPIAYRRKLLKGQEGAERMLAVLDLLEEKSVWKTKPASDIYRGVAVHESFGSVCGYVIELKKQDKQLSIHKITAAIDCGLAVNPGNIKAQVFSSATFAMSMLLGQEITIENGKTVQSNFHNYPVARLSQMSDVDVHIVDSTVDKPTGVGEPGVPPFIPAFIEAIHQATGQEINAMPLKLNGYELV